MGLGAVIGGIGGFLVGGPTGAKIGATIGGGLDASSNAKKERSNALKDNKLQWVRHRDASIRGGFNPLTTMGMNSGQTNNPSGVVSVASTHAMVNGFVDAANSYAYDNDPIRDLERERLELGNDLAKLEIEKLTDIPPAARAAAVGSTAVGTTPSLDPSAAPTLINAETPVEAGVTTQTSLSDLDADWFSNPLTKDAAAWAERLGEPGEIPGAVHVAMSDAQYNTALVEFARNSKWSVAEVHQQVLDGNGYVMDQIFRSRDTWDTERQRPSIGDFNAGANTSFGGDPSYYSNTGQDPQSLRARPAFN